MVTVALWIVWVAPYVLRNRGHQLQPAVGLTGLVRDEESVEPQSGMVLTLADQQEKPMESSQVPAREEKPESRPVTRTGSPALPGRGTAKAPHFRIRYGRLAIAVTGLVMLLSAAVMGVMRLFGAAPGWLPAVCLLLGAGSVVLLRRLAVKDRRSRVNAAFRAAMSAPGGTSVVQPATAAPRKPEREPRPAEVFDGEEGGVKLPPLSAFELRQAALAVAAASGDLAQETKPETAPSLGGKWEPVEVPKPVYVDAAKAERPAPEPLELPEAPKPLGKPSLRKPAAPPAAVPAAAAPASAPAPGSAARPSALSNLDDVLQRRRA